MGLHEADRTDQAEYHLLAHPQLKHPLLDTPGELPQPAFPMAPVQIPGSGGFQLRRFFSLQEKPATVMEQQMAEGRNLFLRRLPQLHPGGKTLPSLAVQCPSQILRL
ncbi:hypothetical protein D3C87_1556270 [compost metagenome]